MRGIAKSPIPASWRHAQVSSSAAAEMSTKKPAVLREDGAFELAYLTNREVLAAADPREYRMTYLYDSFAWSHCADEAPFLPVGPPPLGG